MSYFQRIRDIYLLLLAAILVSIIACLITFSETREGSNVYIMIWAIVMLLAYSIVSYLIPSLSQKPGFNVSIKKCILPGIVSGVLWSFQLTLDRFYDFRGNSGAVPMIIITVLNFVIFWFVSFRTMLATGKIPASLFASVWTAMSGVIILFIYTFVILFVFEHKMEASVQELFLMSGMRVMTSFIVLNSIRTASVQMIVAPLISVVFGTTAVLISQISSKLRK